MDANVTVSDKDPSSEKNQNNTIKNGNWNKLNWIKKGWNGMR